MPIRRQKYAGQEALLPVRHSCIHWFRCFISACGSQCGSEIFDQPTKQLFATKNPQKPKFSGIFGAATQIRTGDLILTKRPRNFVLTIFSALWPYPLQTIFFSSLFERKVSTHSAAVCGRLCGQTIKTEDFCNLTVCTNVFRPQFSAPLQ